MADTPTFREQVLEKMIAALGEPEVLKSSSGGIYRWALRRAFDMNLYVTMDAPERPDLAHIMLSDGPRHQDKPLVSFTITTPEEADALVAKIVKQWKELR